MKYRVIQLGNANGTVGYKIEFSGKPRRPSVFGKVEGGKVTVFNDGTLSGTELRVFKDAIKKTDEG